MDTTEKTTKRGPGRPRKPVAPPVIGEAPVGSPLEFLEATMRNPNVADAVRVKAAIAAAAYRHVKLSDGGKKLSKQEAAKAVASGRFQASEPPRLVRDNTK